MKRVSNTVVAELDAMDRRFSADNQLEDPYNATMARAGHPLARPYRRLRAFYDSLRYASNSGARMFSYASEHEHAAYWAPRLLLGAGPMAAPFERFGKVGPGHPSRACFVDSAAAVGFPATAAPGLWPGTWFVRTSLDALRAAR